MSMYERESRAAEAQLKARREKKILKIPQEKPTLNPKYACPSSKLRADEE